MFRPKEIMFGILVVALTIITPFVSAQDTKRSPTGSGQAAAQTLSGGTGTVRRVSTVGPYVGLSRVGSSVSPDGRYLAYTDWTTGDLAVRDLVTGEDRRVTNKGPFAKVVEFAEFFMQFSGDGKRLAHIWDKNGYEIRLINVDGTGSRFIYGNKPGQEEVLAFDWSADGKYIAAVLPKANRTATDRTVQIALIRVTDGSVQGLKDLSGPVPNVHSNDNLRMSFSPDGRFLAYDFPVNGELQKGDIFVLRLDSGQDEVKEMPAVAHPANDRLLGWTPDGGALLFASDRAGSTGAWLQPLGDGKPQGAAQRVQDNIGEGRIYPLGFTRDGAYYYATSTAAQHEVYTASLDLEKGIVTDSPVPAPRIPGSNEGPEWSPDGKFLAYIHNGSSIVIRSLETGTERTLKTMQNISTIGSLDRYLRWSPDGRALLVPQARALFLVDATTGEASPMVTDGRSRYGRWSADGKAVFYSRKLGLNDAAVEIIKLNLETQQKDVLYTSGFPGELLGSHELSPDGRSLAFTDAALERTSGDEETVLMVMPAAGGQPRLLFKVPASESGSRASWTTFGFSFGKASLLPTEEFIQVHR